MSGGSYDYAYRHIEDLARAIRTRAETELSLTDDVRALRHEFADRLELFARAAHDVEWVDSGDKSPGDEVAAIRAALGVETVPSDETPESLDAVTDSMVRAGLMLSWPNGTVVGQHGRVRVGLGQSPGPWACVVTVGCGPVHNVSGPCLWPTVCAALRKAIIWCAENGERQAEDVLRRVLEEVARV